MGKPRMHWKGRETERVAVRWLQTFPQKLNRSIFSDHQISDLKFFVPPGGGKKIGNYKMRAASQHAIFSSLAIFWNAQAFNF